MMTYKLKPLIFYDWWNLSQPETIFMGWNVTSILCVIVTHLSAGQLSAALQDWRHHGAIYTADGDEQIRRLQDEVNKLQDDNLMLRTRTLHTDDSQPESKLRSALVRAQRDLVGGTYIYLLSHNTYILN